MRLYAPSYYKNFECIAEKCTHNCCIGWEIDIDAQTLSRYDALQGDLGDEIRRGIVHGEDGACFALDGAERCPNLDERGLCRIIRALGEDYLCDICREHPRFYNEVQGQLEVGLGAACEAAAALILGCSDYAAITPVDGAKNAECPETVCDFDVIAKRKALYRALCDTALAYDARLARILDEFGLGATLDEDARRALFERLEYLDEAHRALFATPLAKKCPESLAPQAERFFAYLIYRHASAAQSEWEFRAAVSLAGLLERLFVTLVSAHALSPVEAARIVSKELEYSEDNTDAIAFALQTAAT